MSSGQRFKFLGSQFQVQTGFVGVSPSKVISAVTKANPGVVTSTGHGFADGDVVRILGVAGMTELNSKLYVVDNQVANSFELANYDTTNNRTYIGGGALDEVDFSEFCELTGTDQADGTASEEDVSTICSTSREFELGLPDSGSLTVNFNLARNSTVQAALRAARKAGTDLAFKVIFPNAGGTTIMIGKVQSTSFSGSVGSPVWTGSATIKLSGDTFDLAA